MQLIHRSAGSGVAPAPPGPHRGHAEQTHEVILMTASQPTRRAAAVWRTARRAAAVLRAIHDEQVLMWELSWQSSRVRVDRAGPLAWTPTLDGPRLTGSHLPIPDGASTGDRP